MLQVEEDVAAGELPQVDGEGGAQPAGLGVEVVVRAAQVVGEQVRLDEAQARRGPDADELVPRVVAPRLEVVADSVAGEAVGTCSVRWARAWASARTLSRSGAFIFCLHDQKS